MRKLIKRIVCGVGIGVFSLGVAFASPKSDAICSVDNHKCLDEHWDSIQTKINDYPYWKSFELFDWFKQFKRSVDISAQRAKIAYYSMTNKENAYCHSLKLIDYMNNNPVFSSGQNDADVITPDVISPCQSIEE